GGTLTAAGVPSPKVRDNRSLLEFRVYAETGKLSVTGSARRPRRAPPVCNNVPGTSFFRPCDEINRNPFLKCIAEAGDERCVRAPTPLLEEWVYVRKRILGRHA
ncbi:MAG: hypothetical protein QHJ82_17230, partial [Verrucomicrobiota bacterium]|nr:hypothetical protein [Verrucomicrobiota bacterium]